MKMAMVGLQLQRLTSTTMLSLLILFLGFPFFLSGEHLSGASDSISLGKSLSGSQTIVSRGGKFELGFFTPGNSRHCYVGIWYKNIAGVQTVIWVANRGAPVATAESSTLRISPDGNLVLLSLSKIPIWSSNTTSPRSNYSTVAVLLDTGNLVLKESSSSPGLIWQSFDHPTDTWVPGQFLGMNKITGDFQVLTSWKSSQDPAPGMFSLRLDDGGSGDYLTLWNGSMVYDRTGAWNGHSFAMIPQLMLSQNLKFAFVETKERKYFISIMSNDSVLLRLVMAISGQVQIWTWLEDKQEWMLMWSRPVLPCDVYALCGAFGICNRKGLPTDPTCRCLHGFKPKYQRGWNLNDWSGGCVRISPLKCVDGASPANGRADVFYEMPDVKFPTSDQRLWSVESAEGCKLACLNNCSCSAYAYDGACNVWSGQLHNLQQLSDADGSGGTLHLRLAASSQPVSSVAAKSKIPAAAILGSVLGGFLILFFVIALLTITRRFQRRASAGVPEAASSSLSQFKYSELQQITRKFSTLLGRGGFGSVFAGVLPDLTPVAVKRLQGLRQGEKQFRAEVRTLCVVRHANLVRLHGFCAEDDKRLLVYEYVPKGSLDAHLFNSELPCLDWRTRYKIALGTAKGLAYLHDECRERIIHCDIKPENILLDELCQPKVADFGMAKLIARDFSRVLTTIRGTRGYLAPEWVSGLAVTPKADVYSFGMVLFELISGRRNAEIRGDGGTAAYLSYFPLVAARTINEGGDVLRLLDHKLGVDVDVEELTRVCKAACWCIQDEESRRPTMGQVVRVLEGGLVASLPPIPRCLLKFFEYENDSDHSMWSYSP